MKQHLLKISLTMALSFLKIFSFAQVIFEHAYPNANWYLADLGNNNFKYIVETDSSFDLYNINHTPYLLNIQLPFHMMDTVNNEYHQLGYVTTTLFDCDSTNIEYALMLNHPCLQCHPNFAVYRTDGTQIFSKDSVGTMMCYGCGSGSYEIRPIMNTSEGAKLYLFNQNTEVLVYGLCGTLPHDAVFDFSKPGSFVRVFPNPSSQSVNFEITLPGNLGEYEMTIFNSEFQTIKTSVLSGSKAELSLGVESIASGTYFYSLQKENKLYQNGKFIISK